MVEALEDAVPRATLVASAVNVVDLARQVQPGMPPAAIFAAQAAGLGRLGFVPRYLDDSGHTARITIRLRTRSSRDILDRVEETERALQGLVKEGEHTEVVGVVRQIAASVEVAVRGQALAVLLSVAFVSLVASLALGTWRVLPVIDPRLEDTRQAEQLGPRGLGGAQPHGRHPGTEQLIDQANAVAPTEPGQRLGDAAP